MPPLPQIDIIQQQRSSSLQARDSDSSNRRIVPALDFGKLHHKEEAKNEEVKDSSSRYVFDRSPFQDLMSKMPKGEEFNAEMLKLREDAINYQETTQSKYI